LRISQKSPENHQISKVPILHKPRQKLPLNHRKSCLSLHRRHPSKTHQKSDLQSPCLSLGLSGFLSWVSLCVSRCLSQSLGFTLLIGLSVLSTFHVLLRGRKKRRIEKDEKKKSENNYWLLIKSNVCVCVQQNILDADLNKTRYLLRSGNSVKRKTTPGQPNLGNQLSKNKASYKTLVLTYPYAVVIPLTLTRSPS
jgi:hypothetical protein